MFRDISPLFSIDLSLKGFFFFPRPVSISYSRCHFVCHFPACHAKATVEWDAAATNKTTSLTAGGLRAGARGSHGAAGHCTPFSYSRVQFSESYLGYYSNPYPPTPSHPYLGTKKNSRHQFGHWIGEKRLMPAPCPPLLR